MSVRDDDAVHEESVAGVGDPDASVSDHHHRRNVAGAFVGEDV